MQRLNDDDRSFDLNRLRLLSNGDGGVTSSTGVRQRFSLHDI